MARTNHEQAVLAMLDSLAGLDYPLAISDGNADRILISEQVTLLLDTASASTLHALAALLKAARDSTPAGPW
jgi:hypothetical protein